MQTARRPYWLWSLDRWNLLVAILLALLLLLLSAREGGEPAQVVAPRVSAPAAEAALLAGQSGELAGLAAPNAKVRVFDGDQLLGETQADATGQWRLTLPALAAGAHSLRARVSDAQGKVLATSEPASLTVSAPAGAIPAVTSLASASVAAPPALTVAGEAPAVGAPLTLEGTGTPGATVQVYDGDELVGETTVGADGTWTLTVPPLAAGEHSLVAKTSGADGAAQGVSQPLGVTVTESQVVVATPPAAGAAAAAAAGAATSGLAATSEATAAPIAAAATSVAVVGATTAVPSGVGAEAGAPLTLEGTGTPGSIVKLYDGDTQLGEATVGADGKWTMTVSALAAGAHSLIAKYFDADGKEQAASQPLSVTIPAASGEAAAKLPAIILPAGTEFTAGAPVELGGMAAPGVQVKLYDGEVLIGEATADASGNWQMSVPPLAAGEHTLTAVTYGPDGEVQGSSQPLMVAVPEAEPALASGTATQPTIGWPVDGSTVVSAQPLITGQAFPGGAVSVYDGGALVGETVADSRGRWSFRPPVPFEAGQHALTVAATTPDGQTTVESQPVTIAVRTRTVMIPSRKPASDAAPAFVTPAEGSTVNTVQPLFAGTAAPNVVVRLYDGAQVMGEATADSAGRWSFRPTSPLSEGEHTITAVALNADGTESAAKSTLKLTVASGLGMKPAQLLLASALPPTSSNSRPALTGQASPGATVRVYDGDQLMGEIRVGPDGRWHFVPAAPLAPGAHVLRVEVVGADGAMLASAEYPVEVVEGARPVEPPKVFVPAQGQTTPGDMLSGTASAGGRVQIYDGSTLIGTTTAGTNGRWRFKLPKDLPAGTHAVRAVVLDQAGTPMSQSPFVSLEVAPPLTLPVTGAASTGR